MNSEYQIGDVVVYAWLRYDGKLVHSVATVISMNLNDDREYEYTLSLINHTKPGIVNKTYKAIQLRKY